MTEGINGDLDERVILRTASMAWQPWRRQPGVDFKPLDRIGPEADGRITAILRIAPGVTLELDGASTYVPIEHPTTGLYRFAVVAAPGRGMTKATLRVRGAVSAEREVVVAVDRWDARDGRAAGGGCSMTGSMTGSTTNSPSGAWLAVVVVLTSLGTARSRSPRVASAVRRRATAGVDRPC